MYTPRVGFIFPETLGDNNRWLTQQRVELIFSAKNHDIAVVPIRSIEMPENGTIVVIEDAFGLLDQDSIREAIMTGFTDVVKVDFVTSIEVLVETA